jgi:hexosaminidase
VVRIADQPAFAWRGYMLDVSRHFFGKEKIKEVLDFMARLKLNRFHWHLADDQGWRLEIKKYPKLTSVGAWRVDYVNYDESVSNWWGRPLQKEGDKATYGGFYTQEDIKELIAYAKERYIEILPEIDVPGHSMEKLASYPELSCDGGHYTVATGGVSKGNALCPSNDFTYTFLEEVLGEVMDLFPFDYIHIGGDECNKDGWKNHRACQLFMKKNGLKDEHELQSYFIKRVEKMVNARGKKIIGWDEIMQGGLAPNATVMSWRGEKGGIAAAKSGHNVIMSPSYANYLDLKQGQSDFEPNLGYSLALLSTCYNYKVIPKELTGEEAKFILGTQGNLWTESISDWGKLTYMTFPRLFAVAENGRTSEYLQDFDDFVERLRPQLARMNAKKVRYAKSVYNVWVHQKGMDNTIEITLDSELSNPDIRYTLDGSTPKANSSKYTAPFVLTSSQTIKAAIFKDGQMSGDVSSVWYPIHKAAGARVIYHMPFSPKDSAGGQFALTDLNFGQSDVQGDHNWQGFENGLDVEIVFDQPTDIQTVRVNSLKKTIRGTYPPTQIELFGSTDGVEYTKIGDSGFLETSQVQGRNRISSDMACEATGIKNLRIKAKLVSPIPEGHHKAGEKGYLKIDEIIVL